MRHSHFAAWAPHCPVCARDRGTAPALVLAEGAVTEANDVVSGILVCSEPTCRHEYPIIDGIPIIMAGLRQHLGERAIELLLRDDLDPAALSLIGDALGPDSWLDVLRQGLSTYVWDAYADLDPDERCGGGGPEPGAARRCLARLQSMVPRHSRPSRVLDLGCAAGRTTFDLADTAPEALVLGIDTNLGLLRVARQAATSGMVCYGRRRIGLVYDARRFPTSLAGRARVDFWACDAAALPFAQGMMDLVLALNLLDCVPDPAQLLHGMAAALKPGGSLLLATPFDWAARATPVTQWIGGHSQRGIMGGAAEPMLQALFQPGGHERSVTGLTVAGVDDLDWHTRLHDRAMVAYRAHLLALSKSCNEAGQASLNGAMMDRNEPA